VVTGEVEDSRVLVMPNESDRGGLRRKPGLVVAGGGTGISLYGLEFAFCRFLSDLVSIEEGFVEEELSRAEDAALPFGAVERDPPLPLPPLSDFAVPRATRVVLPIARIYTATGEQIFLVIIVLGRRFWWSRSRQSQT
jgi:hypothetical protein